MAPRRSRIPWSRSDDLDVALVRAAVRRIVESVRFDDWLLELPADVLVQVAAPLEVLAFHYHLDASQDRHLVRAARVAWESVETSLPRCPPDMAQAFRELLDAVTRTTW
jgi:hypothetical protein